MNAVKKKNVNKSKRKKCKKKRKKKKENRFLKLPQSQNTVIQLKNSII